jgi:UDP-N-acetylmuramoyl-L-alanyl-D-glutamate--2,6-diaminopimelate ligase
VLLSKLLAPLLKYQTVNFVDVEISSVTTDSRRAMPGCLFIAISGYTVDGHHFLQSAAENGAIAFLVEESNPELSGPQIVVPDTKHASAMIADIFYQHPSRRLSMIGVTGTNGKTTVTHLIEAMLNDAGHQTGLIGTIENRIAGTTIPSVNTTPEAVELQALISEMGDKGCKYGIMEVSSHALELGRVAGTHFHIAVFTNLTQDHLDFHETMDAYRQAKGKLFSRLGNTYADNAESGSYAVLNTDDLATGFYMNETVMEYVSYGIERDADVRATNVQVTPEGVLFQVQSFRGDAAVKLHLTGRFNVYNALAAICVGLIEGMALADIVGALERVSGVPGRLEPVLCGQPFSVLVDYSHTPDSLENALSTIREFVKGKIITVVGCGGDRDKTKRPLMARVSVENSEWTILTSDNPRTENPDVILDDMEAGVRGKEACYERVTDRKLAIYRAVALAGEHDVVLVAGKGHEDYQIIGKTKHHFDDREIAAEAIRSQKC